MSSDSKFEKADRGFEPSGFFALRTPLLPFDELLSWSDGLEATPAGDSSNTEQALEADRQRLRARLRDLVARPLIRDALFVASPDLDESLEVWRREPGSERGLRIERAIVRYFSRMAGRATPFGLFAGTSVGRIADRTRLVIEPAERSGRRSRLDMDYLFALAAVLTGQSALRRQLDYRPNSSLYTAAGRFHYVEARLDGKNRTHHLVAVEDSQELRDTLALAANGARWETLALGLVTRHVSREEAESYVGELIESQILCPDLTLFLTGPDPAEALATRLRKSAESVIGEKLDLIRRELAAIDACGPGAEPARYRSVAKECGDLPAPVELPRLFQVDMIKRSPDATLGGAVLEEITRGVEIMRRLAGRPAIDDLTRFRDSFVGRYEEREVPLVEALDEEVGIGFPVAGGAGADAGPLLKGIVFPEAAEDAMSWGTREDFLLEKVTEAAASGSTEIELEPGDVERLERKDRPPLPDAFAATASIAAADDEAISRGDFRVFWQGCDGPSGARLLGRFCDADPQLLDFVRAHLRAEEALEPDAIFAEIVHLPEGRLGNILYRPILRGYEIPYLGGSGISEDRQIPVTDLRVSVSRRQIVLRSARLNRRIVPRLTSAHNFRYLGLPIYRFLCELQRQNTSIFLGWDWGPLASAPFLPRVVSGRLVLSPARWTIGGGELKPLAESESAKRFAAVQTWRAKRRLTQWILLAEGDNLLPVDLSNVLSVESFVHLVKDHKMIRLTELYPGPDGLCARSSEGRFIHELVVPFVRRSTTAVKPVAVPAVLASVPESPRATRQFAPGSEWLYAKLYAGTATTDSLLRDTVAPLVRKARRSGAADRWFFIRYDDPDHHLRLRLHGPPARLFKDVLADLQRAAAPLLADGRIWKLQLDTYEREVERYGGPEGIELAERVFQADSEAVLAILERLEPGDAGADERWRLALRGIDSLLEVCGLELPARWELVERLRGELAEELRVDDEVKHGLGSRFRKESRGLDRWLEENPAKDDPLAPGIALLRRRSRAIAPLIRELQKLEKAGRLSQPIATIASSYVHMHVNRMLRAAQRMQEYILYDFLARLYKSRAARANPKRDVST
jgi:thiopeptide-type bacteriocin biosynthesis protein